MFRAQDKVVQANKIIEGLLSKNETSKWINCIASRDCIYYKDSELYATQLGLLVLKKLDQIANSKSSDAARAREIRKEIENKCKDNAVKEEGSVSQCNIF